MTRLRPMLRASVLGLPLLLGGCLGDVIPGPDTADASCVLLCALQRQFTGEPAAVPPGSPASPVPAATRRAAVRSHATRPKPPSRATRTRTRVVHRRSPAHVSMVPQAPSRVPQPAPVALEPPGPAPVALTPPAPLQPARSMSEAIPGSAGIRTPEWREH